MKQNKQALLAAVSILALSSTAFAHESNVEPAEAPPSPYPAMASPTWSGLYGAIGGGGRFAFGNLSNIRDAGGKKVAVTAENGEFSDDAAFGTIELGYDVVTNGPADKDVIFGVVGNFDFGSNEDSLTTPSKGGTMPIGNWDIRSSWGIGARAGILATPTTLIYGLGGFTMADIETTVFSFTGKGGTTSATNSDWTPGYFVGAGVEKMLTDTVGVKIEYRFSDYDDAAVSFLPPFSGTTSTAIGDLGTHSVRASFVFRFGG